MRFGRVFFLLLVPLFVACKVLPDGGVSSPTPSSDQSAASDGVLDNAESRAPSDAVRPKPRPGSIEQSPLGADGAEPNGDAAKPIAAVAPEPMPVKLKEQLTCEKRGGTWGKAGKSGGKTCIKRTRDAGKQCTKQSSCDGVCLARSGTCAPVTPLFGCNEILQNDGSRVTLCVD